MAQKEVKVVVTSKGLKETTAEAQKLNKELDKVEKKRKVSTTGSRAADAALLSSEISTGLGRGTAAGNIRGDTRDFARQAQGLGGLVHVYATFAANVFAVAAAFNALSRAMDFELMVKSAEIMSTRVGTSLTNVANDIYTLTDAAVSLKDAFAAGNLAANAGLTTTQIQGLAKAAKGASLAMGRDMTDSLNRIFRGTVKIEPELLDELGLMVKVNDVNKEYAKTLGKSVTALTDFERRQAFVNGVLEQAEVKYSELANTQANAFSQLQASIINLSTTVGTFINSVLNPLIGALASSPTALFALLGSLVGLLVRQAIPAFKNMKAVQNEAFEELKKRNQESIGLIEGRVKAVEQAAKKEADAERLKAKKIGDEVLSTLKETKSTSKSAKIIQEYLGLSGPAVQQMKGEAKKAVDELGKAITRQVSALRSRIDLTSAEPIKIGKKVFSQREALEELKTLESRRDHLALLSEGISRFAVSSSAYDQAIVKSAKHSKEYVGLLKQKVQLQQAENKANIRNSAINAADTLGAAHGFKTLWREVKETDLQLGKFGKTTTLLRGGFNVLSVAATRFLSVFSVWGAVIGLGTAAIIGLLKSFDLISDKAAKAKEASDATSASFNNLYNIIEKLAKASTLDSLFEGTTAKFRAQAEALSNLSTQYESYLSLMEKGTNLDIGFEWIKENFDFGLLTSTGEALSKNLEKAYKAAPNRDAIEASIMQAFEGVKFGFNDLSDKPLNVTELFKLIEKSGNKTEHLTRLFKAIQDVDGGKSQKVADAMANMSSGFSTLSDNAREYTNALITQNKEFDSAISILSSASSTFDTATYGDLETFTTSFAKFVKEATNAVNLAYISSSNSFPAMQAMAENIKQLEKDLKARGATEETRSTIISKRVQELTPDALKDFGDYILAASNELLKLANATYALRTAQALSRKDERINNTLRSYTGAPEGSESMKRENRLLKVQQQQLEVQKQMLISLNQADMSASKTNEGYLLYKDVFGFIDESDLAGSLKRVQDNLRLNYETLSKTGENDPRYQRAEKLFSLTSQAASSLVLLIQKETTQRQAIKALEASQIELKSQENKPEEMRLKEKAADNELAARLATVTNNLEDFRASIEILENYSIKAAYGIDSFDRTLAELNNTYDKQKRDLTAQKTSKTNELDRATEARNSAIVLASKKEITYTAEQQRRDTEAINILKKEIEEIDLRLNNVDIDKTAREFSSRLEIYTQATSALKNYQSGLYDILDESVEFNLKNTFSLGEAIKSTKDSVDLLNRKMLASKNILDKEIKLYEEKVALGLSEEEQVGVVNKLIEARLEYHKDTLSTIKEIIAFTKLERSLRMKEAESTGNMKEEIFSTQNLTDFATEFISILDDGMSTIESGMIQVARGLADSINQTIDLGTELFQKGELTFKSFIDGTRNILSDMFKNIASDMFKKAIGSFVIDSVKNLDIFKNKDGSSKLETDREKEERLRRDLLSDNTTALGSLGKKIEALTTVLSQKAVLPSKTKDEPISYELPELNTPSISDIMKSYESYIPAPEPAQTFPLEDLRPKALELAADPAAPLAKAIEITLIPAIQKTAEEERQLQIQLQYNKEEFINTTVKLRLFGEQLDNLNNKLESIVPKDTILNQEDFEKPTGYINPTSGSIDFDEVELQLTNGAEALYVAKQAQDELTYKTHRSAILQQEYIKALEEAKLSHESMLPILDRVNESLERFSSKLLEFAQKDAQAKFDVKDTKSTAPAVKPVITETVLNKAATTFEEASNTGVKSASTAAEAAAQDKLSTTKFWDSVLEFFNIGKLFEKVIYGLIGALSSSGSGGEFNLFKTALGLGIKGLVGGITSGISSLFTSSFTPFAGSAIEGINNFDSMNFNDISAFSTNFAKGGIMSPYGPLKLARYASGGIAKDPQMAIFGEGSMNEAFVPLPDGKSIPVSMNGSPTSVGDTNISISVNINNNGSTDTKVQAETASRFSRELSAAVRNTVQEELIKQQKFGGLLYR